MVRNYITPAVVSEIIHEIFKAENRYILDSNGVFIVSRSEANLIMERIMAFGSQTGLITQPKQWSGRYLVQIYHKKFDPVPKLISKVLLAFAQTLDGVPAARVGMEEIMVLAKPGTIRSGTVVNAQSHKCKRPQCQVYFVKNAPNQLYCTTRCGYLDRKQNAQSNGHGGQNEK